MYLKCLLELQINDNMKRESHHRNYEVAMTKQFLNSKLKKLLFPDHHEIQ